ncbi:PREDICTED: uncharacterized protein LOC104823045 [Tarenaya hassleriana]|uniref:uncharacterized protein LOC104823045 n=1 Tax=Tarenaya hassleriana TaxID=28532 RepID=UPI00053C8F77|nr:PREDICTED: uncharacterized protein LOC104823045 [Tarenaya hassleriana]
MRDFPTCFGENGVQVADSSSSSSCTSKAAQNLVTCVYHCNSADGSFMISISWFRNLMGQGLSVAIDDSKNQCICKVDIKPWIFARRKGSKGLEVGSSEIGVFWDLSRARFACGPDPTEGFYLAVVLDHELLLLLGDMKKEAYKKIGISTAGGSCNAVFVAKKEHVFGKKLYTTRAQFHGGGRTHDIAIECDAVHAGDPCLSIRIDGKRLVQIRRLKWKFRGNDTVFIDGLPVDVFWDVHSWLFGNAAGDNAAVFMFRADERSSGAFDPAAFESPWLSCPPRPFKEAGFTLILYAHKSE